MLRPNDRGEEVVVTLLDHEQYLRKTEERLAPCKWKEREGDMPCD